jgi:cobalt-zinc-cadmium efflux system membrane fusion protein
MKRALIASSLVLLIASTGLAPVHAGEGHDHGDAPAAPSANGPQRQPDGSVFLPKPAQRQLGVRTLVTEAAELPRTVELGAKVLMDPNAGGKVQPLNAGRIEPGPRGLPNPGAGGAQGRGAGLRRAVGGADRALQPGCATSPSCAPQRHWPTSGSLACRSWPTPCRARKSRRPRAKPQSLAARIAAVGGGLSTREALVAPVSGVIASANVVAGQVVDARELVFEIVDPSRLRIEALAFDAASRRTSAAATMAVGEERVPLTFVGASRSLREQALPLAFRAQGAALAASSPSASRCASFVQTRDKVKGVSVPVASLMKNPANQTVVWVKTGAGALRATHRHDRAAGRRQRRVTSGLKPGDRVAVRKAPP